MSSRLRQLVARAVGSLPNQCDADATAWAAGVSMRRWPWFPQSPGCRVDSLHEGECMCGRLGPGMDAQADLHAADELPEPDCDRPVQCLACHGQVCLIAARGDVHDACGRQDCLGDCEGEYNDGPARPHA